MEIKISKGKPEEMKQLKDIIASAIKNSGYRITGNGTDFMQTYEEIEVSR